MDRSMTDRYLGGDRERGFEVSGPQGVAAEGGGADFQAIVPSGQRGDQEDHFGRFVARQLRCFRRGAVARDEIDSGFVQIRADLEVDPFQHRHAAGREQAVDFPGRHVGAMVDDRSDLARPNLFDFDPFHDLGEAKAGLNVDAERMTRRIVAVVFALEDPANAHSDVEQVGVDAAAFSEDVPNGEFVFFEHSVDFRWSSGRSA